LGFRADLRAAAVTLLRGYKTANPNALKQIYPGRPLSIFAPCAFIDSISESGIDYTPAGMQRTPAVSIRFVQGQFDSEDTVTGQDALVDGFIDYVVANRHAAGANTLSVLTSVDDDPSWVPEWIPDPQRAYYSTVVVLSGEGLFGGLI
jgi:hypothetical protein